MRILDYFTADWHLGHANIIEYCHRPFKNTDRMKHTLISNYRKVVTPDDTIYFVGDMALVGPANKNFLATITEQLPGNKILIFGNHDKLSWRDYIEDCGFRSVHSSLYLPEYDFYLCHDPVASITMSDKIWICGHTHHLFKTFKNIINVSVENWEYFPVSATELIELAKGMRNV